MLVGQPCLAMSRKKESVHDQLLHLAALQGDLAKLRLVLGSGRVHVDVKDSDGTTPLMLAVANRHLSCARELLEEGADVNLRRDLSGSPALFYAAQNGQLEMVKLLVRYGASVNEECRDGQTTFMAACQENHLETAEFFAAKGADVSHRLADGATAVFLAAQQGNLPLVRWLMEIGVDPKTPRKDETTCLWIAAQEGHVDVVEHLLETGSDANKCRVDGATPLFKASQKGHLEICQLLLLHKPCLGLLKNGFGALHGAAWHGKKNVVRLLCEHGADPALASVDGKLPRDLAKERGYLDVCQVLELYRS